MLALLVLYSSFETFMFLVTWVLLIYFGFTYEFGDEFELLEELGIDFSS